MLKSELGKQLYRKCQLDLRKQELERSKQTVTDQLPQAKADKREADFALHAYECGGFRVFLDKLSGIQEEKQEALVRKAAASDSVLRSLQRELERIDSALEEVRMEYGDLDRNLDVIELAQTLESEEREVLLWKAAGVAASRMLPLLQSAKTSLEEAQEWARPHNRIDVAPGYTKGKLLAEAEACARQCNECLCYIAQCGILLEIHPYFHNPSGYIHGVAAEYAELDRINRALDGIRQTIKQTEELMLQLSEEEKA